MIFIIFLVIQESIVFKISSTRIWDSFLKFKININFYNIKILVWGNCIKLNLLIFGINRDAEMQKERDGLKKVDSSILGLRTKKVRLKQSW